MAAVTSAGITFDTNAGNKVVNATPAANDLIVVIAANTGATSGQVPGITDNQAGLYERVNVVATMAIGGASMWAFVRTRLVPAASATTWTMVPGVVDTGGGLQVFRISGMSIVGQGAVRGAGVQVNAVAGTPAPVLLRRVGTAYAGAQAALTGNVVLGAIFNGTNPATMTIRAGWTESQDVGYATPTTGLETGFINSGETASTLTWGSASGSAFGSLALEIDASVPQYDYVIPGKADKERIIYRQGPVGRQSTW